MKRARQEENKEPFDSPFAIIENARSVVWSHFLANGSLTQAKCLHCNKTLKIHGNTSACLDHLRRKHPETLKQANEENKGDEEAITKSIIDMIVLDLQPFTLVEDVGFRRLMNIVAPTYKIPCRKIISTSLLQNTYLEIRLKMMHLFGGLQNFSLTSDTWTSCATEKYLTLTLHFIDNDWVFKSFVLSTEELATSHTGSNLQMRLSSLLEEWNLPTSKLTGIVTDNGSNIVKAIELLRWQHFRCFAHTIQLSIKPILEESPLVTIIQRFRNVVTHYHHSGTATTSLAEKQVIFYQKNRRLQPDVKTRWNSTHIMLVSVYELKLAIDADLRTNKDYAYLLPTPEEWEICKQVINLLRPFRVASETLSHQENVTISCAIPIVNRLKLHLSQACEKEHDLVQNFRQNILTDLLSRSHSTQQAQFASFLDPRYKKLDDWMRNPQSRAHFVLRVQEEMKAVPYTPPERSAKITCDEAALWGLDSIKLDNISQELEAYQFQSAQPSNSMCPLTWWKSHEKAYPRLSLLARKYLCLNATSTPSERVFSTAGDVIDEKRSRLLSDNADSIIFLNKKIINRISTDHQQNELSFGGSKHL